MNNYEGRIEELGIKIPEPPEPVGSYIPARKAGDLIFCSGQGPKKGDKFVHLGKVGSDLTVEEGYEAARVSALNCLAEIKTEIGSLNKIDKIVKVRGFVSSAAGFGGQPSVVNGASELLIEIFGDSGKHARAALGTSELPGNIPIEVEMIASIG
ncbi:MAG: RidA family protein [Candidatus Bipolaricaulota bacterium]|nr:RidA family protein [Candidatus Bipolaricaulota bacterium]MBS3792749.1 RidA family protein [Candidatus Bipolaricaulota bacterium]